MWVCKVFGDKFIGFILIRGRGLFFSIFGVYLGWVGFLYFVFLVFRFGGFEVIKIFFNNNLKIKNLEEFFYRFFILNYNY